MPPFLSGTGLYFAGGKHPTTFFASLRTHVEKASDQLSQKGSPFSCSSLAKCIVPLLGGGGSCTTVLCLLSFQSASPFSRLKREKEKKKKIKIVLVYLTIPLTKYVRVHVRIRLHIVRRYFVRKSNLLLSPSPFFLLYDDPPNMRPVIEPKKKIKKSAYFVLPRSNRGEEEKRQLAVVSKLYFQEAMRANAIEMDAWHTLCYGC